jgi:hypothetical protein
MAKVARSRSEVTTILEEEVVKSLAASGVEAPGRRGGRLPASVLEDVTSLCGVEITVELEQRLGVNLEDNVFLKLVDGRWKRRTWNEVLEALASSGA